MSKSTNASITKISVLPKLHKTLTASAKKIGRANKLGYGKCSKCSCPGFQGNSSTCSRSGCGHHYDDHW